MLTYFIAVLFIAVAFVALVTFAVMAFDAIMTLVAALLRLLSVPLDTQTFFKRRQAAHNEFEDIFGR